MTGLSVRQAGKIDDGKRAGVGRGFDAAGERGAAVAAEPARNERLAGPALRQPQVRQGQRARRAGQGSRVAWVYNRAGAAGGDHGRIRELAPHPRWEGAEGWVYHSLLSGKRTALVAPQSKSKDELLAAAREAGCRKRGHRQAAARRAGTVKRCAEQLVPPHRRRLRRLDRAAAAVGRLSEREGGVGHVRPAGTPVEPSPRGRYFLKGSIHSVHERPRS